MKEDGVTLNSSLVEEKGLSEEDIVTIKCLHKHLDTVKESPEEFLNPVKIIEALETSLQLVWGFPTDNNYHSYWTSIKGCLCPKLDNLDCRGTGRRYYNMECPWHSVGQI